MQINNLSLLKNAQELFNTKGASFTPEIEGDIQPVIEIKPRILTRSAVSNNDTQTLYTTPNDNQSFYLTGYSVNVVEIIAGIGITPTLRLLATIDNLAREIGYLRLTQNQATHATATLSFFYPIRIDKNTAIQVITAGDAQTYGQVVIFGYLDG